MGGTEVEVTCVGGVVSLSKEGLLLGLAAGGKRGLEGAWSGDFEGVWSAGFKKGVSSGVGGMSFGTFSSSEGTFGLRGTEGW